MVRFSEIQEFPDFLEPFPGSYRSIYFCIEVFRICGRIESAPRIIKSKYVTTLASHKQHRQRTNQNLKLLQAADIKRGKTLVWLLLIG